ncbi:uncharacterized protein LOC123515399 [Portunus trituberculatus]|uniref:uncharacterized protein LOC123515399 n=1 Tax=Portunus trituberculatus TaxID=210409 RepID=UPI001E1D182A|nr:uncharacterized protein LOC123515399 [Portunus trituberculatus]
MKGLILTRRAWRRACPASTYTWALLLGVWAAWGAGEVHAAPHPHPDSPDSPETPEVAPPPPQQGSSSPSSGNALGMLLLPPRTPIVVVAGGRGSTAEDIMNIYLPVIMAEMKAPVSTRDPSIIRVAGCRPGFNEDPLGACRPVFVPRAYLPRTSRPNRQTNIASLLPVRPRPRVPRPQPQTQRDLIRQFNTSRRRQTWFGRSLSPSPSPVEDSQDVLSGRSLLQEVESADSGVSADDSASLDVSMDVHTTTPDSTTECDD